MAGVPFVPLPADAPLPAATNAAATEPDLEGHVMVPIKACADILNASGNCGGRLLWITQQFGTLIPEEIVEAIDEVGNRLNAKSDEFERVVQGCPRYDASLPCVGVLTPHRGPVTAEMVSQREAVLQDLSDSGMVDVEAGTVRVEWAAADEADGTDTALVDSMGTAPVDSMGTDGEADGMGTAHVDSTGTAHVDGMGTAHVDSTGAAHVDGMGTDGGTAHDDSMGTAHVDGKGRAGGKRPIGARKGQGKAKRSKKGS